MPKSLPARTLHGIATLALALATALPAAGETGTPPGAEGTHAAGFVKVRGGLIRPPGVYRLELERIEKEKRARQTPAEDQPVENKDSQRCAAHERFEERNRELHDALRLRPDQESAWADFLAIIRPENPHGMHRKDAGDLTAPERMKRRLEGMEGRLAAMQRQLEAVEAFYTLLTPEQRKVFDAEFNPKPHRWGGRKEGATPQKTSAPTGRGRNITI